MSRPNQSDQQRKSLLPIVCRVFSELGYRRTTTAELAEQCGVRENILYRLWPDKKSMFLAAIDDIFQRRIEKWNDILADQPSPQEAIERLVSFEAKHQGEFGFYRVIFTALMETDDEGIRVTLAKMYRLFYERLFERLKADRADKQQDTGLSEDMTAWALIGLATISNIIRELDLLKPRQREKMFVTVSQWLIKNKPQ
jgi:AcrR family transcriptional regulator